MVDINHERGAFVWLLFYSYEDTDQEYIYDKMRAMIRFKMGDFGLQSNDISILVDPSHTPLSSCLQATSKPKPSHRNSTIASKRQHEWTLRTNVHRQWCFYLRWGAVSSTRREWRSPSHREASPSSNEGNQCCESHVCHLHLWWSLLVWFEGRLCLVSWPWVWLIVNCTALAHHVCSISHNIYHVHQLIIVGPCHIDYNEHGNTTLDFELMIIFTYLGLGISLTMAAFDPVLDNGEVRDTYCHRVCSRV